MPKQSDKNIHQLNNDPPISDKEWEGGMVLWTPESTTVGNHHLEYAVIERWKYSEMSQQIYKISEWWYISRHGADSNSCGKDSEDPCLSFPGLWKHPASDWYIKSKWYITQNVVTDTDLNIENLSIYCPQRRFIFQNLVFHVINITITNTTIEDTKMKFNGSNISLVVDNSLIRSSKMDFTSTKNITITNSRIDETELQLTGSNISLRIEDSLIHLSEIGFHELSHANAQFSNCSFQFPISSDTGHETTDNFIHCFRSNVTVELSVVREHVGSIMKAEECDVKISHCVFGNNSGSILKAEKSKFRIENSQFLNNTNDVAEIITISEQSNVVVVNSTFSGNRGVGGGALRVQDQSVLKTAQCWFVENIGKKRGGAVHISYESEYHDYDSCFVVNIAGIAGKF